MAYQRGSQVNPALGMVDYAPIARGGEAMARGKVAGTQAAVGGAMQGLDGILKGVEQYQKNKQVAGAATAAFEGAIAANPELLQVISAPEAPPKVAAAFKKLQKGAVDADNATMLAGFAASFVQQKQAAADLAFRDMQARQMGQQAKDSEALAASLAQFQPGNAPEGIARPARPFNAQEFMSGYVKAGGSPRGIEQVDAVVKMMSPQAPSGDATSAQRDTEAIINARVQAGLLDPKDAGAVAKLRASLLERGGRSEPTRQPYQGLGPMTGPSGEFAGYAVLDQATGGMKVVKPEAEGGALKPTTATGVNRAILSGDKFLQLRETLVNDEIGLRKLTSYLKNVKDAKQGIGLLADKFATAMTTFLDLPGGLTPQQLAAASAEGRLQGLLGSNRLDVLGGGTLTETDALRIISFLGGDAGALRNKERVQEAISTIFNEKLNRYQRHVEDYNIQSRNYYGSQGYKEVEPIQLDMSVFEPIQKQAAESGPVGAIDREIQAIEARVELLSKKSGGKK